MTVLQLTNVQKKAKGAMRPTFVIVQATSVT